MDIPPVSISVCICTFRRPILLLSLLAALSDQQTEDLIGHIQIVVVDNDPANSARTVLDEWRPTNGLTLVSLHLPSPNIALARNAAIAAATSPFLAFIDDDEIPQDDWLVQMFRAHIRFKADAVFGPVVPRYLPGTAHWLIDGGYFERRRFATGTLIGEEDARTGNVLLKADILHRVPGPFHTGFGRTGGEDSMLFRQLQVQGNRFVWCDEATVEEDVPLDRANAKWLLLRSYRVGQTWIRAEMHQRSGAKRFLGVLFHSVRSFALMLVAVTLALVCITWSRTKAFKWLRNAVSQAGKLTGLTRFQYLEYGA